MLSGLVCNGNFYFNDACHNVKLQGYVAGDLVVAGTCTKIDLNLNVDGNATINSGATGSWVGTWAGTAQFTDDTDATFNLDVAGYGRRVGKLFEPALPSFTTTDGSLQHVCSLYVPNGSVVIVDADVVARSGNDSLAATQKVAFERHGGTLSQVGNTVLGTLTYQRSAGASGWQGILWGFLHSSDTNVQLQVQGAAGATIQWSASVRATYLGAMNP